MIDPKLPNGEIAPEFALRDLEGRPFSLEQTRGVVTAINFWSAECPWSERVDLALLPELARWGKRVKLLNVASNANETTGLLRQAADERGFTQAPAGNCLVLTDPDHQVADLYGAVTTPHFFVLDAAGVLRYQGAFDDVTFRQRQPTQSYLIPVIEALLAGRTSTYSQTPTFGCTIVREMPEE